MNAHCDGSAPVQASFSLDGSAEAGSKVDCAAPRVGRRARARQGGPKKIRSKIGLSHCALSFSNSFVSFLSFVHIFFAFLRTC